MKSPVRISVALRNPLFPRRKYTHPRFWESNELRFGRADDAPSVENVEKVKAELKKKGCEIIKDEPAFPR
jgi:hypothetical protein